MPIQLKNIKKSFVNNKTQNTVLNKISLDINDNELVAIMGRSGAGKSTLLNIIGCLDNSDEGEYLLDGKNINDLSNSEISTIRNEKFGFIMQDFALIEDETVKHNIMLPTYFSKKKKKYECEKIAKTLGIKKLLSYFSRFIQIFYCLHLDSNISPYLGKLLLYLSRNHTYHLSLSHSLPRN